MRRFPGLTGLLAAVLVAAGCGSRVGEEGLAAALGRPAGPVVVPDGARAPVPLEAGAVASRGPRPSPASPVAPATGGGSSGPGRPGPGPAPSGRTSDARATASGAAAAPTAPPTGAAGRPAAGTPAPSGASGAAAPDRPAAAAAAPILIGSVGTLSGPVGAAMRGGPEALRVWARALNDRGGLAGHEVRVAVGDDGGDPGRYQSLVRDLVENKGVVAFVSNMAAFTLAAGAGYLESKRVPVIGGDLTTSMWHDSPMFFPQSGGEQAMIWGMAANAAATGKRRFGSLTCRESQGCQNADRYWYEQGWVAEAGMQPAYQAQISIAQPDYTAECLSAQRAGVEVLAVVADGATARRVAASCARQNYRPVYTISGPTVDDRVAEANTGALEGTLAAVVTFPYVRRDTPATAEFHAAMRRYGTEEPATASTAQGWVAAKLFERAATAGGDPTRSERILDGLWSLAGETLGGLTSPRTFVAERSTPDLACFFTMRVAGPRWVTTGPGEPVCRQPPS